MVASVSAGGVPRAGSFLLARVEQLLVLVHVLEAGFGYFNAVVKGNYIVVI